MAKKCEAPLFSRSPGVRQLLFLLAAIGVACSAGDSLAQELPEEVLLPKHMPEKLRGSFSKVVVLPGAYTSQSQVAGTYHKPALGAQAGAAKGAGMGTVSKEIFGVPVGFPIPIISLPAQIIGGIVGGTQQQIQDFRDALTSDLQRASDQPLTNDALAADVYWRLRSLPALHANVMAVEAPVPPDTDAILYVYFSDMKVNVQGKDATIKTSVNATLRRMSDGEHVFEKDIHYTDRDTLSNWTKNDTALWKDYANFARHYLAREVAAQVFDRVDLQIEMLPQKTKSVSTSRKDVWSGTTKSVLPTFAWTTRLLENESGDGFIEAIDQARVSYEFEIYDKHRIVYGDKNIQETEFTMPFELEGCKTYKWSVRPMYQIGSDVRYGPWMRIDSGQGTQGGGTGIKVSDDPAYIYDFASLKVKC